MMNNPILLKQRLPSLPTLSPRLALVANLLHKGHRLIDVGCDHAHLSVLMVGSGHCTGALATDIRPGPCSNACATVARYKLEEQIRVLQTDGLQQIALLSTGVPDDIVIAGMGGEMMVRILQARPDAHHPHIGLVLQPQTDLPLVRHFLYDKGYDFTEHLVAEGRRLYHVFRADVADLTVMGYPSPSLADLQIGHPKGEASLVEFYHQKLWNTLTVRLEGLRQAVAPNPQALACLSELEAVLDLLRVGRLGGFT